MFCMWGPLQAVRAVTTRQGKAASGCQCGTWGLCPGVLEVASRLHDLRLGRPMVIVGLAKGSMRVSGPRGQSLQCCSGLKREQLRELDVPALKGRDPPCSMQEDQVTAWAEMQPCPQPPAQLS